MHESGKKNERVLTEAVMLARLNKADEMREFFIDMWKQNPALAKQGGVRVQNLLSTVESKQRGISLIELIIFIVIISVALTGILLVMNQVTAHSADPIIHKQAIAVAESLLEEIELQDFNPIAASDVSPCAASGGVTTPNPVDVSNRTCYHTVADYHGFNMMAGIKDMTGVAIPGLESYSANVSIDAALSPLGAIAAGSAVRITVTVTDPQNNDIAIDGYRTAY